MKRIGILGGLGPESTKAYYEYITREYRRRYNDYAYPEIIIYSLSFQEFIDIGYESAEKVKTAIESLHKAGAEFVVAACNSIHIVFEEVSKNVPIPWLSIIDAVAEEIKKSNMDKVGLLGTIFTMSRDFYKCGLARHGIEAVVPDAEGQNRINDIIYKELVRNEVIDTSRHALLEIVKNLGQKGAEGIILGCTELPFLIKQKDTPIKIFDTTVIHARKALDFAMEGK